VKHNHIIAPSILAADLTRLGDEIAQAEAGGGDWIHIDVMDGHFVPNITLGTAIVKACRRATSLPLDVHLMIEEPDRLLQAFTEAGADMLTVHLEACPQVYRTLTTIKDLGLKTGLALNPGTPVDTACETLPLLDKLLVMTVNPGFAGQRFIERMIPKIAAARETLDEVESQAYLQIDGGVTVGNIGFAVQAGADAFVVASSIFKHPDGPKEGARAIREALRAETPEEAT
jgi:ribulose-phosphate 3-epimerase